MIADAVQRMLGESGRRLCWRTDRIMHPTRVAAVAAARAGSVWRCEFCEAWHT